MEEKSLAMEMLQELKKSSKRWYIISTIELFIIVSMIVGFVIYNSQFEVVDEVTQYVEDTELDNSTLNQNLGV